MRKRGFVLLLGSALVLSVFSSPGWTAESILPNDTQIDIKCSPGTSINSCISTLGELNREWKWKGYSLKFVPNKDNIVHTYFNGVEIGEFQASLKLGASLSMPSWGGEGAGMEITVSVPANGTNYSLNMQFVQMKIAFLSPQYITTVDGNFPGIDYGADIF